MDESVAVVSDSAVRAAREVRTVVGRVRRRLREAFDPEGLTPSQTSVLSRLSKTGPASASDLAAAERIRHQSMTATLTVLEERGLVVRTPDPTDGRRQLVSLCRQGRDYLEDKRQASMEWLARSLQERCTEGERELVIEAMAILDRLAEA